MILMAYLSFISSCSCSADVGFGKKKKIVSEIRRTTMSIVSEEKVKNALDSPPKIFLPRCYVNETTRRPRMYWDYESLTPTWGYVSKEFKLAARARARHVKLTLMYTEIKMTTK
jgi:hypothetical protein